MPRKAKSPREKWNIQDWRGYNYAAQFEKRAYVQALPEEERTRYARAASALPCPTLNIFGVGEWTREQERRIFQINQSAHLDVWYLNPWYCTEEGWSDFQEQWKNLPEPAPLIFQEVVHTHMCTTSEVVHIPHKKARQ